MEMSDVVSEIKLSLTGDVLELEIEDATIEALVNRTLREIERYFDETKYLTIPFVPCIDLTGFKSSAIVGVYRTEGVGNADNTSVMSDPLYMQQWMVFSNAGTMLNLQDYALNYGAWSTMSQIRNTLSTDMSYTEDTQNQKLYINTYMGTPSKITIEYIPKLEYVNQIKTPYWQDILIRMSLAHVKIALGRIRTRYTQSNSLITMDGDKLLEEGNTELTELREILRNNDNMILEVD